MFIRGQAAAGQGASAKITLLRISASCPEGHQIPLFVRFQLPHKPEHVLKEGTIRVRVTGWDGA